MDDETLKRFGNDRGVQESPLGRPTRLIVLGYYDGPTDGLIQFDSGLVFHFFMPAGEAQGETREFVFLSMPPDALDRLEVALAEQLTARRPAWYVGWQFASPEIERDMASRVEAILAAAGPPTWSVTLPDSWTLDDFHPIRIGPFQPTPA